MATPELLAEPGEETQEKEGNQRSSSTSETEWVSWRQMKLTPEERSQWCTTSRLRGSRKPLALKEMNDAAMMVRSHSRPNEREKS